MWCGVFVLALAASAVFAVPQGPCGVVKVAQDQLEDEVGNRCNGTGRIVGGCQSAKHSWPWMTSLRRQSAFGGYHTCGAQLISENWVLTAAHCVQGSPNPAGYRVDFGRHHRDNVESTLQSRTVKRVIMHPQYNQGIRFSNDAALLELATPAEFNNEVSAVCLPRIDVFGGERATITGWGNVQGTCCSNWLKQARVPILSQEVCRQPNILGSQISDSMVCASPLNGGTDTCQGDSGGPLVYKNQFSNGRPFWQVNGLTSWGYGCAMANRPGVYARVSSFLGWIKQVTDLDPPADQFV